MSTLGLLVQAPPAAVPVDVRPAVAADVPAPDLRAVAEARLLQRLAHAAVHPSDESVAALRSALTDLVDRLKQLGMTVERVVAVVEALVPEREHVLPLRARGSVAWTPTRTRTLLCAWTVRAYRDDEWW